MEQLVTVVIPSYNHGTYIEDAILSVINQTYSYIQLIVIDDCSTDGSHEIISRLNLLYDFKYIRHKRNLGLISTFNEGIRLVNSQYFSILASDDCWREDKISRQIKVLDEYPNIDCVATRAKAIGNMPHGKSSINFESEFKEKLSFYGFSDVFMNEITFTPSLLIRKNALRFLDESLSVEDLYLWLELTKDGKDICVVNEQLIYYRYHESNSHKKIRWLIDSHLKTIRLYSDHVLYRKALFRWKLNHASNMLSISKIEALKLIPFDIRVMFDIRLYKLIIKLVVKGIK